MTHIRPHPPYYLATLAGRPVTLPRDLKHYRAPRPAHRVLRIVHAIRMAAALAVSLAICTALIAALFSIGGTP